MRAKPAAPVTDHPDHGMAPARSFPLQRLPMTSEEFRAALAALGLSQSEFAREVERIGGERLALRTVQRWTGNERRIPPLVPALLAALRHVPRKRSRKPGVVELKD